MRIGCLGEVMLELVPGAGDDAMLGVAGDTYNTAVYMAHELGAGTVDYITVLGEDGFSQRIMDRMESYQIGTGRILRHPTRIPGLYAIETDEAGERHFTYWRSAAAARELYTADFAPDFSGLTHLFYSGISLAILSPASRDRLFEALEAFRAGGGIVAFDSNYRPKLWARADAARDAMARAWASADVALPSIDDEAALFGDASEAATLARFRSYGVQDGALKRGSQGPVGLDGSGVTLENAPRAKAVDSTAAGDSFNAAYLAARFSGAAQIDALSAGHNLAARVVGERGAIII